jgi:hypothetical protein
MHDKLIEKLRKARPGIDFISASDAVIEGHNLEDSGNRSYGKNLYVATGSTPKIDLSGYLIGKTISVGSVESFAHCELRCTRSGKRVAISLTSTNGNTIGRELQVSSQDDSIDEALFAWFGPSEDICTPWSDNDPPQCQVITLEGLRAFARKYKYD